MCVYICCSHIISHHVKWWSIMVKVLDCGKEEKGQFSFWTSYDLTYMIKNNHDEVLTNDNNNNTHA